MKIKIFSLLLSLLFLISLNGSGSAANPDDNYIRIIGGDPAGNSTGDLPAYEGTQNLKCPAGYSPGSPIPNPYKDDKILFKIDYTNVDKYKDRLAPGQYQRVKQNKKFFMNIYPTRRNHLYPKIFYDKTEQNLKTCRIDQTGNLVGFNGGVPFPNPKNGAEAIWNVKKNWMGDATIGKDMTLRYVSPSGKVTKMVNTTKVISYDTTRLGAPLPNPEGVKQKMLVEYTYPADSVGFKILIIQYMDDNRNDDTWLYFPALRRVRRAASSDRGGGRGGESTLDEQGNGFRGLVSEWNWKLLGKKEIYVPMNCYDMFKIGAKDEDECWARDINPTRVRYELHRMWVIEGTLKSGMEHDYSKRVEYCDEDSWYFVHGDRYDMRGNLWRVMEFYTYYDMCQVWKCTPGILYVNLESGRYEFFGGNKTEKTIESIRDAKLDPGEFTVNALKRGGR